MATKVQLIKKSHPLLKEDARGLLRGVAPAARSSNNNNHTPHTHTQKEAYFKFLYID